MTPWQWAVVVPQKDLRLAKSRMELDGQDRRRVARALLRDTVTAARATPGVCEVVVVLDRARDLAAIEDLGVHHVLAPGSGLNEALARGERAARAVRPRCGVAALPADLPLIEPALLGHALALARTRDRTFVADADHRGTTLLTAAPGHSLHSAYGIGSREAHRRTGAFELTGPRFAPLRLDVDHLDHLLLVAPIVHHANLSEALARLESGAFGHAPSASPRLGVHR
ncbi:MULTISPECIES: 2-phospho-L-lactate guanylyltransferase [unclassified Streptomyces]|uniref:2-phospho-L-lactate guanylyltransferase n=1 Tax=unclassified Streptomyces TaxID=2593676 RepID=UPI002251E0C1|nr:MULTISPECIES: 2-phospho-L-lactate guanylyltransferase [unclassified Streptomyces]MCX5285603.1 2-phospho-L-lactate guanylyltransferase [Streptomyces sp. NBC_00198]